MQKPLNWVVVALLFCSVLAFSQTYTVQTFAGGGLPVNIPGTSAKLGGDFLTMAFRVNPYQVWVALDSGGNTFISASSYSAVLRLDRTSGLLTLVAGNGTFGFSGDGGPATSAQLNRPAGIALDAAGNLYIADLGNSRIRIVAASTGVITTVAGNGTFGFSGDNGPATSASLNNPQGIAVDSNGNLYIAVTADNRIRMVAASTGVITTVAGNGTFGFSGDNGPATSASLNNPQGIAVDSNGNLYIADTNNSVIRKVAASTGTITTVAGGGSSLGNNGPATNAKLANPQGIAVDNSGNMYIADTNNGLIRKVTASTGVITAVAGGGSTLGDNGPATSAALSQPIAVGLDAASNIFIADAGNRRVRMVSSGGIITTVAGGGSSLGDNGPAIGAQLGFPASVALDPAGRLYIADFGNSIVRSVVNSVITSVVASSVTGPGSVIADSSGNLYISDSVGLVHRLSSGVITTVAGGGASLGDNGPATSAQLGIPTGLAVDSAGNLYIAASGRIRKVSNGIITTIAGGGSSLGDGGPATSAQISPIGIALDAAGNLYIADYGNNRIRKVTASTGVITTVAGNGSQGYSGDGGQAASSQLARPSSVAVDPAGNLYIADYLNNSVRKVSNGIITTIAGNGVPGFTGDNGPATSAQLSGPVWVALDSAGNIYVADINNNRVRILTPSASSCALSVTPTSLQPSASGGNFPINIQTSGGCAWSVTGLPTWITVSGASSGTAPATITLAVAANSGPAQSATISVAGVSVTVNQAGSSNPGCTYSLSSGGQAFTAGGGSGSFIITTTAGCSWTASSTATWITTASNGTGSGTVSYNVAPNTGAAILGTIAIAGLSFTVDEGAASVSGYSNAGSMTDLAVAGGWTTTFTLVNPGTTPSQIRLSFFDDNGNPLTLPLNFPQSPLSAGPLLAATIDQTLAPGAVLEITSTGPSPNATVTGWAKLLANGTANGFATYRFTAGSVDSQALIPLENRNASKYLLAFDNTNGFVDGIALANNSAQGANIGVVVRDATGAVTLSSTIALNALGHTSFVLPNSYGFTAGQRGSVEFDAPSGGQISAFGIQYNTASGAFSTIPPLVKQ